MMLADPASGAVRAYRLDAQCVDELLDIQDVVCAELESPTLYYPVSRAEMLEFFQTGGFCVGVECGARLVGFFGILLMGDRSDNVGYDLKLPAEMLPFLAYFKAVNVLPSYRGMGLQKELTLGAFAELARAPSASSTLERPPARVMAATVSPLNLSSVKSFLDTGFWIAGLKPKFNGYLRYLVMRWPHAMEVDISGALAVSIQDYAAQMQLLEQGYLGVQLRGSAEGSQEIFYVKPDRMVSGKDRVL
ncbi:MAG: hypothetical protein K9K38_05380 [Rhodoferax sp.]|nr:hypothetical protein [Rhodoferax sp.]MCF8208824.1 hypothetical protein [Rhodoferax sp.]